MTDAFLFSVPSAEPVSIEPFNYAIVGQTQFSGKTTLIKRLATWAEKRGFRVLIFDSVPAYTPVFIRDDRGIDILSVEDLYTRSSGKVIETDFNEKVKTLQVPLCTLSPNKRNEAVWHGSIIKIVKHPYNGNLIRLNTIAGIIDVSPNHSVIKARPQEEVVDANKIAVGDILSFLPIYEAVQREGDFFGTEDLAWIYGIYCAEGWPQIKTSTSGGTDYSIHISNSKGWILDKTKNALEQNFHHPALITDHEDRGPTVEVHSKFVYDHFVSRCGVGSRGKHVPKEILNGPSAIKQSFLDGYYSGDGHPTKYGFRFATNSQVLAMGVIWLQYSLEKRSWSLHIRDDKPDSIEVVFNKGSRNRKKAGTVKKIRSVDYEGDLYDLVVSGDSTFCAGVGPIRVHNTKETEADYAGFGREVPVCLRETWDAFVLIGLLESMFRRRLTQYYATLTRITEGAKGYDDIIANAKKMEEKTRSSWLKDACRVLYDLMERLKAETSKVKTVPKLQLQKGINRMVINEFSLEAQQLIVKNAFEDALRIYKRDLILVLDEAFKFIPQGYSSPATRAVMQVITQGAKTGLYTWISTQFLAVTDKDPLKACAIKFLGTQDHITEVKHTLDLVPEVRGKFSKDDVMNLKVGHWILVRKRPRDVRVVYALPVGVPGARGRAVAMEEVTPEYVRDHYLKVKKEDEKELVYKEKWEKEKRRREELEKEFAKQVERVSDLKAKEKVKNLEMTLQATEEVEKELRKSIISQKNKIDQLRLENKDLRNFKQKGEATDKLREALTRFLRLDAVVKTPGLEPGPSEVNVTAEQPSITVETLREPLGLSQKDLLGKIAIVYSEGQLPQDKWFTVTHVTQAFIKHGWKKDPRTSKKLDQFCEWGYFEKHYAGKRPEYRLKMSPGTAREKGLLKVKG